MNNISAPAYSLIRPTSWWMEIPVLLGFNLLLVCLAQVAINLPFSPVPITGQTLGVTLIAMALGRTRGVAVVSAYILEGILGLPVFANGMAGAGVLLGPTGGYLIGFVVAAWVIGSLADRGWDRSFIGSFAAMTFGTVVIFACGLSWLSRFVEGNVLLSLGLFPFVPGALVKLAIASIALPSVWKMAGRKK